MHRIMIAACCPHDSWQHENASADACPSEQVQWHAASEACKEKARIFTVPEGMAAADAIGGRIAAIEDELLVLTADRGDRVRALTDAESTRDEAAADRDAATEIADELNRRFEDVVAERDEIESRLDQLDRNLTALTAVEPTDTTGIIGGRIADAMAEMDERRMRLEQVMRNRDGLADAWMRASDDRSAAESTHAIALAAVATATEAIAVIDGRIAALDDELADLRSTLDTLA